MRDGKWTVDSLAEARRANYNNSCDAWRAPAAALADAKGMVRVTERKTGIGSRTAEASAASALADERRIETLRATRSVIAREGFEKASMRAIARELGTTTGVLTHHFRNKEEILDLALHATRHGKYDGRFPPDARFEDLFDALTTTLPHNEGSLDSWKVFFSFLAYLFPQPDKAERYAADFERWRKAWAMAIATLADRGEIRDDIDPQLAADTLLCLFEGAGVHGTVSPESFGADRQTAVLIHYFETLRPRPGARSKSRGVG